MGLIFCADASGKQVADFSWWPKASVWEKSTLDVGLWSLYDEVWFQTRLEHIRARRQKPKTVSAWKEALKSAKNARRLRKALEAASKDFLEANAARLFEQT